MCLLKNVLDVVQWLFLFLLGILDKWVRALRGMVPIDLSILSLASCMSCSLTTVAVGVLADFTEDFSLDACTSIVDVAGEGCAAAGIPEGPPGAGIFDGVWGLLKLTLGLAKHVVPITEVVWAVVKIVFEVALDLFPDLVADGADLLAFAMTMSDAAVQLALLYAALVDPAFDDITDTISGEMHDAGGTPVVQVAVATPTQIVSGGCTVPSQGRGNCSAGVATVRAERNTRSGTLTGVCRWRTASRA